MNKDQKQKNKLITLILERIDALLPPLPYNTGGRAKQKMCKSLPLLAGISFSAVAIVEIKVLHRETDMVGITMIVVCTLLIFLCVFFLIAMQCSNE